MWKNVVGLLVRVPRRTGLAAVAFQVGIDRLGRLIYDKSNWLSTGAFLAGTLMIICTAALFTGFLLSKLCPEAAGSGIPQLKLAFWKDFGHTPPHIVLVRFVAGVIGIGGGLSPGREGPSVQIGGNLGSTVAGLLGVSKQGKRAAVAAGAASALAAAFNAPLAGVAPAFQLPRIEEPSWRAYLLMPMVAVIAALIGVGFQRTTLALRGWMRKVNLLTGTTRPVLGGVIIWVLGMAAFSVTGKLGVFGIGYDDLSHALQDGLVWQVAGLLLLAKWLATVACYGSGGCGGIFSPLPFLWSDVRKC